MKKLFRKLKSCEKGQIMSEYAIVLAMFIGVALMMMLLLTIFADDMNLYFDTRDQMQTGAIAFINHLLKWGLKVHVSPTIDGQSKSKAMLCPGKKGKRVELQNDGTIIRRELQDNMEKPISVPGGYIPFCQSYIFLGSVWTKDMKMKAEIQKFKREKTIK